MTLTEVMDAIASTLSGTVTYTYAYPAATIQTPAAVVGYPDIEYDLTMGRGADRATFPVWVTVGKADQKTSRDALSPYIASVKTALDGTLGGVVDSARVVRCSIEEIGVGEANYVAARFDLEVIV